jgi:hypothetical protein
MKIIKIVWAGVEGIELPEDDAGGSSFEPVRIYGDGCLMRRYVVCSRIFRARH